MQGKGKGKGVIKTSSRLVDDGDDNDDNDDAFINDSEDSGSEFQASEVEFDSDGEEVMLDAAIHMSLQSARLNNNGAGSSSTTILVSSNPRAALHAAAAERRLASSQNIAYYDVAATEFDSSSECEMFPKRKAKDKSKTVAPQYSTPFELRKIKREDRLETKRAEAVLVRELGRRLTPVTFFVRIYVTILPLRHFSQGRKDHCRVTKIPSRTSNRLG